MTTSFTSFWRWCLGLILIEGASFIAFAQSWETVAMVVLTVVVLVLAWKRPIWLTWASMGEIVIGGKGYLFFTTVQGFHVSVRDLLFLILLIRWAPVVIQQWKTLWKQQTIRAVTWLTLWIVATIAWGVVRNNSLHNVFFDSNAFAALLYVPLWWVSLSRQEERRKTLTTLLLAATTIIGLKGLYVQLVFGHTFSYVSTLYHWIRDSGIGEITLIQGNIFRVFFQGQIMPTLIFWIIFLGIVRRDAPRWWWIPLLFSATSIYLSLSRSFWLATGVALAIALFWFIRHEQKNIWRLSFILPVAVVAWLLTSWAINFPAVFGHGQINPALARLTSSGAAEAGAARQNQIKPLLTAISHHPIWGSGFGTTVTYYSTDPRVRGWRTTTAFELGYLDLWLKIGLIGLVLYGWWVWVVLKKGWSSHQTFAWSIAVVALVVTHLTSPYLNHPLGIGWLALTTLYLYV